MKLNQLKLMKEELQRKDSRTSDEEELLCELTAVLNVLGNTERSLSIASTACPSCGRPYKE